MAVGLETLLEHLGIYWIVLHSPSELQTTKNAADWTNLYNKDSEMVTLLNVRLKGLGANSLSTCLVLAPLSRDDRRFHTGFVYFEWSNREHRVFYLELSL